MLLRQVPDDVDVMAEEHAAGGPRPQSKVELVIIGPECPDPIREVQKWHHARPDIALAIIASATRLAELHRHAMIAPYLPKDLAWLDAEDASALQRLVQRLAASRQGGQAVDHANKFLQRVQDLV